MKINEYKSVNSFDVTIEKIKEGLKGIGFGVLAELSFHDTLEKKGFPISKKAHLMEVCKPALAQGVLDSNTKYSYFLPCKLIVREEEGTIYAGVLSVRDNLIEIGGDSVAALTLEVETAMDSVVQSACK